MKKWLIIVGLLLLLMTGGFLVAVNVIMPRSAKMLTPIKWQNIPLGQKRTVVHEYLGHPFRREALSDQWQEKITSAKRYVLDVAYNADSTAVRYLIMYKVEMLGYTNVTKIAADSIF